MLMIYVENLKKGTLMETQSTRFNRFFRTALTVSVVALATTLTVTGCTTPESPQKAETVKTEEAPSIRAEEQNDTASISAEHYGAKGALAAENITEEGMLLFAVQDEFMALAEYTMIIDTFNVNKPYTNIKNSEETHLSLLQGLYETRGLEFPDDTSATVITALPDLLAAAQHGVTAEIDNIAMYEKFLTNEIPEDMKSVFTKLRDASKKHLNSFESQVAKLS